MQLTNSKYASSRLTFNTHLVLLGHLVLIIAIAITARARDVSPSLLS